MEIINKIKKFLIKNTTFNEVKTMSESDIEMIKSADTKLSILHNCISSNHFNYLIVYEKYSSNFKATIYVFSKFATSVDPHLINRVWHEYFTSTEELNTILHRFFLK